MFQLLLLMQLTSCISTEAFPFNPSSNALTYGGMLLLTLAKTNRLTCENHFNNCLPTRQIYVFISRWIDNCVIADKSEWQSTVKPPIS